uniref:IRG-type G domain-containing protein n=1 Tax=Panagrolaimus sp. ES5 TaxID=591445 RepID=A0AC34FIU9_9BILA
MGNIGSMFRAVFYLICKCWFPSPEIVVVGLKNAGKSEIINAIQDAVSLNRRNFKKISYDEMDSCAKIIKKIKGAKLYLIVVPHTVGRLDALIAAHLFQTERNVIVLLNKSDEHIDNLKKHRKFTSLESYIQQRRNAAIHEFSQLNIKNISMFVMGQRASTTINGVYATLDIAKFLFSVYRYFKRSPEHDIDVPENVAETVRKAKEALGLDTVNFYNFAFIGHAKTGKSSLINAIRGIDDGGDGAAIVDVTECTHEIEPYSHPQIEFVKIYDIPGAGTLTHDANSYYLDTCNMGQRVSTVIGVIKTGVEAVELLLTFYRFFNRSPEHDIVVPENVAETVRKAKEALGLDTVNFYNFAFVGHTKTGKSSLINAIRNLDDDDPDAAEVNVTECTHESKSYSHPTMESVKFYDIPGAGTLTHDANSYYQDKLLCAFDCLFICTQETLGKEEIVFALECLKYNQPFCFVRSRCDIVIDNLKKQIERKNRNREEKIIIDQNAVNEKIGKMKEAYDKQIELANNPKLREIPCFFISALSL